MPMKTRTAPNTSADRAPPPEGVLTSDADALKGTVLDIRAPTRRFVTSTLPHWQ
jgi:hypothetical protein